MTSQPRVTPAAAAGLREIQDPVKGALAHVSDEMWRIVSIADDVFSGVSQHLMLMKGKMLRPTLLLLAGESDGAMEPRATAYAAVLELIHLATLVHDDAVDHSVLRRGMPTINALFTHQVSVIAGDFLYVSGQGSRRVPRSRTSKRSGSETVSMRRASAAAACR